LLISEDDLLSNIRKIFKQEAKKTIAQQFPRNLKSWTSRNSIKKPAHNINNTQNRHNILY